MKTRGYRTMTATTAIPREVVNSTFFEHHVPIDKMFVSYRDESGGGYARPTRPNRVGKLVAEWDARKMLPIILSMRADGSFAIIDGAHRVAAAKNVGLTALPAYVYIDLTIQDEASLYRAFGDYLAQTPLDKWHAAIAEGQRDYIVLANILRTYGLHVPNSKSNDGIGRIIAVDAILSIGRHYGPTVLDETLRLLRDAWGTSPRAYAGASLRGTAAFLARYRNHSNFDRATFVRRLATTGVEAVERDAHNLKTGTVANGNAESAYGRALLAIHDARKARRLGDWQVKFFNEAALAEMKNRIVAITKGTPAEQLSQQAKKGAATRYGRLAIDVACPTCNAAPGKLCHKLSGELITYRHPQRAAAAKERAS